MAIIVTILYKVQYLFYSNKDGQGQRAVYVVCGFINEKFNPRSASGASLPESANGGQIDRHVLYRFLKSICKK